MKLDKAVQVLEAHNEWRRCVKDDCIVGTGSCKCDMQTAKDIGEAIDAVKKEYRNETTDT